MTQHWKFLWFKAGITACSWCSWDTFPGSWVWLSPAIPGGKFGVPLMDFTEFRVTFWRFHILMNFTWAFPIPHQCLSWEKCLPCVDALLCDSGVWVWLCPIPAPDGSRWDQQSANYGITARKAAHGAAGAQHPPPKNLSVFIVPCLRLAATAKRWLFCGLLLWFVSSYFSSVLFKKRVDFLFSRPFFFLP